MRILVVAMLNSIHTARWVQQFDTDADKDILLFPSAMGRPRPEFKAYSRIFSFLEMLVSPRRGLLVNLPGRLLNGGLHWLLTAIFGGSWRAKWLERTIRQLKPDVIHSLEFQHAGYLCSKVKEKMGPEFPVWIATNWGSDIYLYGRLNEHKEPIKAVLQQADFYSAECARDYELARQMGLKAKELPVIPNAGGYHLEALQDLRAQVAPALRKTIVIKGYQTVFGRALTAIEAIEKIGSELKALNIDICVCLATEDVEIAAQLMAQKTALRVRIIKLKQPLPHDEMMKLYASARVYVGLSISDGISTSMLEAMALGAFPIQTCTSCANEWVEDGVSGFIAPCGEAETIGQMILKAASDDVLVENAAALNWKTISEKGEYGKVKDVAAGFYKEAFASRTL